MRLSTFLRDIGRTVAYQPGLAGLLGGCVPTVLFCQLFWWTPEEGDGWFGKTAEEVMAATGLTVSEFRAARAALTKRGLQTATQWKKPDVLRLNPSAASVPISRIRLSVILKIQLSVILKIQLSATLKIQTQRR